MSSIPRPGNGAKPHRAKTGALLLVAVCTLIGSFLRFRNLSTRDFWFDECCTFIYVHNLFDWQVDRSLLVESTNLPYYIVLWLWTWWFGETEAACRALSALAAALTVPLLSLTAYRLFVSAACPASSGPATDPRPELRATEPSTTSPAIEGRTFAIVTAFVAALHPLHVFYANEARAYALWVFMLTSSLLLLVESLRRNSAAWWSGYVVSTLLATLTHYFTLFWIPATLSLVLTSTQPRHALRRLLIANSIVLALFAPYFLLAVLPAAGGGQAWISASFHPIAVLVQSLWAMMPAGHYPAHLRGLSLDSPDTVRHVPAALDVIAAVLPVVILVGAILSFFRSSRRQSTESVRPLMIAIMGCSLMPLLFALAYSIVARPIFLPGRYDLVVWPAFVLLIALVLSRLRGNRHRQPERRRFSGAGWYGVLAVLACCSWVPISRHAALQPPPTVHHRRADLLASLAATNDLVIAFNYDRAAMLYYLHRAGFQGTIVSFPSWLDDQIGWVDDYADLDASRANAAQTDAAQRAALMRNRIKSGWRVFMLVDSIDPDRNGARAPLDDALLREAVSLGLEPLLLDEELLVFEWKAAGS